MQSDPCSNIRDIVDPKSLVTRSTYKHNEDKDTTLTTYTATWCVSCNRIKEHFPEILKDYTLISEDCMQKTDYKRDVNNLIPFFVKERRNNIDKIQTSKPDELKNFLY